MYVDLVNTCTKEKEKKSYLELQVEYDGRFLDNHFSFCIQYILIVSMI